MEHAINSTADCIVLAGGFGTRLQSVVNHVPKPMVLVNNIPFLHILLEQLHQKGVQRFVLAIGYRCEVIQAYFTKHNFPFEVIFSVEEEPLGTGGAILQAVKKVKSSKVLVVNGDSFFDLDLHEFVKQAEKMKSSCTLALKTIPKPDRYGSVKLENNTITSFVEKSHREKALINTGVYFINKQKFEALSLPQKFSFEKDFLEIYARNGIIAGIEMQGYFIDIGIPEDYKKAQDDFKRFTNQ